MTSSSIVRVAAAQYAVEHLTTACELRAKLERWVAEGAANGAQLLVFPEFAGMEFASLADRRVTLDRRSRDRHKLGPLPVMPASSSSAWRPPARSPVRCPKESSAGSTER